MTALWRASRRPRPVLLPASRSPVVPPCRPLTAAASRRLCTGPTAIATPFAPARREASTWARPAASPSLLHRLWSSYLRALARRPLLAKAATSLVCVVIGDSIAQALGGAPYSVARVARLAAFRCTRGRRCVGAGRQRCAGALGLSALPEYAQVPMLPGRARPPRRSSTAGTVVGHHWHRFLESTVHADSPRSARAVGTKVALDQLLLSPLMTAGAHVGRRAPSQHT